MSKYASNKTKLAACLGISRTLLYQFARLPDAPVPRSDGRHHVPTWRKFIASKRDSIKASEKEQLQILCLKIRAEREQYELDVRRNEVRNEITTQFLARFDRAHGTLATALRRMPDELAPRFEGMSVREIHKAWRGRLEEVLAQAVHTICQDEARVRAGDPRESNVVPFERKKVATGGTQ